MRVIGYSHRYLLFYVCLDLFKKGNKTNFGIIGLIRFLRQDGNGWTTFSLCLKARMRKGKLPVFSQFGLGSRQSWVSVSCNYSFGIHFKTKEPDSNITKKSELYSRQ